MFIKRVRYKFNKRIIIIIFNKNIIFLFINKKLLSLDYKRIIILLITRICPFSTLVYIRIPLGLPFSLLIILVYYPLVKLIKPFQPFTVCQHNTIISVIYMGLIRDMEKDIRIVFSVRKSRADYSTGCGEGNRCV